MVKCYELLSTLDLAVPSVSEQNSLASGSDSLLFALSQLEEHVVDAIRWLTLEVLTLLLEQVDVELM
ncbi:hypothetical protein ABG088_00110 [Hydrogenibacillus schlegelii]|uniref:hypothetical protein n=1 Tax=Hydrogenibacillus schlegelii TaxID=1484 RepID=UPI0014718CB5|nr:hypothetical protein [Hydrogenibacillus schlegelii]